MVAGGRVAHRPADRDAGPAARQEPRLRGAGLRDRHSRPTSRPTSPSTRTAQEIARKTIRVNDPLSVGGYTFHQNGFGPAPHLVDPRRGRPAAVGRPGPADRPGGRVCRTRTLAVPGRDVGLQLLLQREPDGTGVVLVLPYRVVGTRRRRRRRIVAGPRAGRAGPRRDRRRPRGPDFSVELTRVRRVHAAHRQEGPGPGPRLAGLRVASSPGITITFYLPRRRVWARLDPDGRPRGWSGAPTATSTSSASSAGCSTTSSRPAGPAQARGAAWRPSDDSPSRPDSSSRTGSRGSSSWPIGPVRPGLRFALGLAARIVQATILSAQVRY